VSPPSKRDAERGGKPSAVSGKQLIAGLLLAIVLVAGLLFYAGMTGGSTHVPPSKAGVGFEKDETGPGPAAASAGPSGAAAWDGSAIAETIHDRKVRDQLRQRILAGWAAGAEPEVAAAAKEGRFVPAPAGPDGGRMDPKYIQQVVRSELMPMAKQCYEELLSRKKGAKGRIEMSFTIAADEKLGAIVEDVEADHGDSGIADEKMTTCMKESLSTLSFRPPAHGGYVTVVYPIEFSDDEDDHHEAGR
jgi:hypothetical protein